MRLAATRTLEIPLAAGIATLGLLCTAGGAVREFLLGISTPRSPNVLCCERAFLSAAGLQGCTHLARRITASHLRPRGLCHSPVGALSDPDDISQLGADLFVGFRNGVGPQGQPSPDGNRDSTIEEMTLTGEWVGQWDVVGKADGVTADPALSDVIATVNEDANSALYTIRPNIKPNVDAVTRYSCSEALPHYGGTDAISIYDGQVFISASAPGTTGAAAPQPSYPAVYSVTLNPYSRVATVHPLL